MNHEAQKALEAIYDRDGALSPAAVVEAAEPKGSPLHGYFTWDDAAAGTAHRLDQARQLIRVAVKVIPAVSNAPVRQFVSLSSLRRTGTGSYLATIDVVSDEARYEIARADAIKALQSLERRFRYVRELVPVWDSLASITAEIEALTDTSAAA